MTDISALLQPFEYRQNDDGTYTVTGLKDTSAVLVVIPYGVSAIDDEAFYDCEASESAELPDGLKSIGDRAFFYCCGLTDIIVPQSVTEIGDHAFEYCRELSHATVPSGVTRMGNYLFSGCSGLSRIDIPSSVTEIGSGAFSYCDGLTSVAVPKSVKSVGVYAFSGCSGLTVFCEAQSQPNGWDDKRNNDGMPVVWGVQKGLKRIRSASRFYDGSSRTRMSRLVPSNVRKGLKNGG